MADTAESRPDAAAQRQAAASGTVIGADGGNSKTDLALVSMDGDVLARVRGRGTKSSSEGAEYTAQGLADLVAEARAHAGVDDTQALAAVYNLANVDLPDEHDDMLAAMIAHGLSEQVEVGNDMMAIVEAGCPDGWGVAVVSGAGINAVGIAPDGRVEGFLALGGITGDWGGGGSVSSEAQWVAIRDQDGRGPATSLRRLVPEHFGLATPIDVAIAIHKGRISHVEMLQMAPVVFAAAADGDAVAREIIERNGREAALMIVALIHRLGLDGAKTPIVLGGSIMRANDPILIGALQAELDARVPGAVPTVLDAPPVAGSVDKALRNAGASDEARAKARAGLR